MTRHSAPKAAVSTISAPQRDRGQFRTPVFGCELEDMAAKADAVARLCRSFAKRPHVLDDAVRESIVNATAALYTRARSVVL
jgi:hypothetical protein